MYHSIVTILLPILNTIPNYHVTAQSRKHYTLSYGTSLIRCFME